MFSFGQDFVFWFYPLVDDKPAVIPAALQAQTPAVYVFADEPSRSAAASGAGAVQTITSWAWDAGRSGWSFTVDGLDDPDPSGAVVQRTYWIAINFRLSASEQVQTVLRSLDLERPAGHATAVDVGDSDLRDYYPHIEAYSTDSQRRAYVRVGLEQVKSSLKSKGFAWARVHRPDQLKALVCYRALSMLFLVQAQAGNDKFAALYDEFKALYQNELDGLAIAYDSDGDGKADTLVPATTGAVWLVR